MIAFAGEGQDLQVRVSETEKGKVFSSDDGEFESILELRGLAPGEGRKLCSKIGQQFSFMPNAEAVPIELPKLFYKVEINNEIVFFGGSFNPWHAGHKACLDLCPSQNILIVPDSNPWKERIAACPWESYLDLCYKLEGTPYSIFPGFCGLDKGNPTIDWLPLVNIDSKSLLIGGDNFQNFLKWKDFEKLVTFLDKIYVTPRMTSKSEFQEVEKVVVKNSSNLEIIHLVHHEFEELSSSSIRKRKP